MLDTLNHTAGLTESLVTFNSHPILVIDDLRSLVVPSPPHNQKTDEEGSEPEGLEDYHDKKKSRSMRWAQRLKRVFNIDIETCSKCGGKVKINWQFTNQKARDKFSNKYRGIKN